MPATAAELDAAIRAHMRAADAAAYPRRYRLCPDPADAVRALLRTQATAGPLSPVWHVPSDYASDDLARIDAAAMLAVAAPEIHPIAAQRISTLRHAIAATLRARAAADAAAQTQAAAQEPPAPPDGSHAVRRPEPPQTGPDGPTGTPRHPDDTTERQDRARMTERQLTEMF